MAATVCRCDGCGQEFVASRSHARWHNEACRKAWKRAGNRTELLSGGWSRELEAAEEALVALVRRRGADPYEALPRMVAGYFTVLEARAHRQVAA